MGVLARGDPGFSPQDVTGIDSTPSAGVARGPPGKNGDGDRLVTSIGAQAWAPGDGERLETLMGALGALPGVHLYMLRPRCGPAYSMRIEGSLGCHARYDSALTYGRGGLGKQ